MAKAPPPSLSFRQQRKGGEVLEQPVANPEHVLKLSRHLVLLIHGYNNDLKDGREAYEGFRRMQQELIGPDTGRPVTEWQWVDIYWPGDADWGIFSPVYYMWSIDKARRAAVYVAEAIEKAVRESGIKRIDIVAHSMGCRLALELIKHLASVPDLNLKMRRVVLMAAAVPTFMFDPADASQLRLSYDTGLEDGALSLFSSDDMVLSFAFPMGQTRAGEGEGWFPTALGHDLWSSHLAPLNLLQQPVFGAGHSDYWGWNEDTLEQARAANINVREFLGFTSTAFREVMSRHVVERQILQERSREEYDPEMDEEE